MRSPKSTKLSAQARKNRWLTLGFTATPILGSFVCAYTSSAPPLFCPFKALTGIPCPGCGLTRSFRAITLGQWDAALDFHLFGPALFLGMIIAIAHCSVELIRGEKQTGFYLNWLASPQLQLLSALMILGYHLTRLEQLNQLGELGINFRASPLASWLLLVN